MVREERGDGEARHSVIPGFFGHEEIASALSASLPPVALLWGPKSVGKWELAERVRRLHGVQKADLLRVKRLTQGNAAFVEQFALSAPVGEYRLCIIRLRRASDKALHTLLKTLEESTSTRFILVTEEKPLDTILSRSEVYRFGLLTEEEVSGALQEVKKFSPDVAKTRAGLSGGQMLPALVFTSTKDLKPTVVQALEAVAAQNLTQLEEVATKWTDEHTALLTAWCYESLTGSWKFFRESETHIRGTSTPLKILMAIRPNLRPRLVVRLALASLIVN